MPEDVVDASEVEQSQGALEALISERRRKRDDLAAAGLDPYPSRFDRSTTAGELHLAHDGLEADQRTGQQASLAGRVVSMRGHGKLIFVTLADQSGTIQLLIQESRRSEQAALVVEALDLGDWIGVHGEVITSRRGELSLDVDDIQMLSKALRPMPDKWHGLVETDTRYRQREVDLLANAESRRVFDIRFKAIAALRRFMQDEGFVEVETPILQPMAGGAIARPFFTHGNALDIELSLRIAPELYLKRLVVGGYEKVFEIARNFRNEGVDTRHSPEFSALEAYRAFGDYRDGMDLAERMIVAAAEASIGTMTVTAGERTLDLSPPWPRRNLLDWLEEVTGERLHPSDPVEKVRAVCDAHQCDYLEEWTSGKLIFELYDTVLLPLVADPVFVYGIPIDVSPLARSNDDDPTMADRFELCIDAKEFVNGYSELNNPEVQVERFARESQLAAQGDLEAMPADAAFVRALEYGLPPTSGIGLGIDRLVMLLSGVEAIRDVILFPMLRPESFD